MSKFEASDKTVKEVLTYIYEIPFFQRGYSWSKDQVLQFMDDLKMVNTERQEEYFLGPIVLNKEDKHKIHVIDGQQRITTITIFLCVVRDLLINMGKNKTAERIHQKFIAEQDLSGKDTYKLSLGEESRGFFRQYIQVPYGEERRKYESDFNSIPKKRITPANKALWDAYQNITKIIEGECGTDYNENENKLIDLVSTVTENFVLISINVNSDSDAFIIFETLNERGMDLSISDLLKNYIFSKAEPDDLKAIQATWSKMMSVLNQVNITQFLRHYWLSEHEKVTEKMLYDKIKTHLKNNNVSVYDFVHALYDSSVLYMNIINPMEEDWSDKKTFESLRNINTLNYKASYPVLLAGYNALSPFEFRKLVCSCENFIFSYVTITDHSPSDLENVFVDICKKLRTNKNEALTEIIDHLKKALPT
ncbi:DUF262 domain-containing protein, partial [Bacillus sp. JJ1566]|uniref:DUF262 domain-containing protein n=1 Tax=Bacillus sp. JJ1566 TaxID=3122961 RepID=UPI002FFF88F3